MSARGREFGAARGETTADNFQRFTPNYRARLSRSFALPKASELLTKSELPSDHHWDYTQVKFLVMGRLKSFRSEYRMVTLPQVNLFHWSSARWLVLFLAVGVTGKQFWFSPPRDGERKPAHFLTSENEPSKSVVVETISPSSGGLDRVCIQPGTVEPFESADLYAKVSGFLLEQSVDIGSKVQAGQSLAKIAVPEYERQMERDAAKVQHAEAVVKQKDAAIVAEEALTKVAEASVLVAKAQLRAKTAYRKFREKVLARFKELSAQRTIAVKTADESEDEYQAAFEAENTATEGVYAAEQQVLAANARVMKAKADLDEAKAEVNVTKAELARSRVYVEYSEIKSPYDGVITKRSFHHGDFIRGADVSGERVPLLSVERTDKMRIVVQIPDRDVPFANRDDPASLEIDALPGIKIESKIARVAESEESSSRTMRAEIDVLNTDGKLRRGMYGRATLLLVVGRANSITIPSAALTGKADGSRATVRVVRNGLVHILPVVIGTDNGIRVEVLSGLDLSDSVVLRANGPVEEGTSVEVAGEHSAR